MTVTTVNPATGARLAEYDESTSSDVDRILDRASTAAAEWRELPPRDRAKGLRSIAQVMLHRREELARLATKEMGKPITQSRAEVDKCVRTLEWFAEHGPGLLLPELVDTEAVHSYVAYEPLGVVFAIMPWNFPYWQVVRAFAPAAAAGDAVVLKHAPITTGCALALSAVVEAAVVPPGLLSVLVASVEATPQLSERVIADHRIAAVTLTGSTGAGRAVAAISGRALKKTVLELGGSDPFIVLGDADLEAAARWAVSSRFQNNGQSCVAAKRIIVEESVVEVFTTLFLDRVKTIRVGDPLDPETTLGPLARDDLRDALEHQVQDSVDAGARVRAGGLRIAGPGFFHEPTVLDKVTSDMPVMTEEVFGPAIPIVAAADVDAAIDLANDTSYGLGSNLWTGNIDRASSLAQRLRAGHTSVNGMTASDPRLPFGGVKDSGYGRELAHYGLREFVNVHSVVIDRPGGPVNAATGAE
jgi:succinate-semialdehyde dehydrogenase/glutarate-semialdehyde dehydrogenase